MVDFLIVTALLDARVCSYPVHSALPDRTRRGANASLGSFVRFVLIGFSADAGGIVMELN
jgi:hypothetical protein